ncbi:LPS export ABC transporter permease LptG [Ponticaulis profundi]|uniref:LPS export ABC transporter permease LptG n=1 Tax=Ponticaulis profundi TaxID=2665222 RepID=A0ABW1SED4_9PROT
MGLGQRLQRYVFRACLSSLGITFAVIFAAILLVDIVEQLRTVGDTVDISFVTAGQLTLMKMPMLIEQTMPFLILSAAILAFSRLSRLSELPAMRAAGLSAWRFLAPLALLAVILGLFSMFVLNPLGAKLNAQFEQTRARLVGGTADGIAPSKNGIWLRQGSDTNQFVIHATSTAQSGIVLQDVKIFEYDRVYARGEGTDEFAFRRRIEADTATLKNGFWELRNVVENTPGEETSRQDALSIPTDLDPAKLLDRFASINTIGFWELPTFIRDTRRAGLDALRYEMHFHSLLSTPILYLAMALIGALVCLRLARLGGTTQLIAWGALSAVLLYFVTELSHSLGAAGAAPTLVAAFAPPVFALFAALTTIAYQEDG